MVIRNKEVKKSIIIAFMLILTAPSVMGLVYSSDPKSVDVLNVELVNQDPDPAETGQYVELRFRVENLGMVNAEYVKVELLPLYPFSLHPDEDAVRDIGTITPYFRQDKAFVVKYKLRVDEGALDGENPVRMRLRTGKSSWVTKEFDIDVNVTEVNLQIGSLRTDPAKLVSDTDEAELSVELQNVGESDAENVIAEISLPDGMEPSYAYSDRSNMGTINGESSDTAEFYVDIEEGLQGGIKKANLSISYKRSDDRNNEYKNITIPLEIPMHDRPVFRITDVEKSRAVQGREVDMILTVENTGAEEAESVSLKAFKESSQPFEFDEKSDFIGNLKPGEKGQAALSFTVEDDAPEKSYILEMEIRYIDDEEVLLQNRDVKITVKSDSGLDAIFIFLGAAVLILLGLYLWERKRKERKAVKGSKKRNNQA
ncbi:MAG: hypothetical protein R6U32_07360 [Candidatus Woesearchaeota archaeon]